MYTFINYCFLVKYIFVVLYFHCHIIFVVYNESLLNKCIVYKYIIDIYVCVCMYYIYSLVTIWIHICYYNVIHILITIKTTYNIIYTKQ